MGNLLKLPEISIAPAQMGAARNRKLRSSGRPAATGKSAAASRQNLRLVRELPLNRAPQEFVHRDTITADQKYHCVGIVLSETR